MKHTIRESNPEMDNISALLDRVRMSDYQRLQAQASLERGQAIADLVARGTAAIRSLAGSLLVRFSHRTRERAA